MEILQQKSKVRQIKRSQYGLDSRIEITGGKLNDHKDKWILWFNMKTKKERDWKKLTQPQRTMKHYHPCHWNHRRREEIAWCRKNNWRNNGYTLPKFGERHKFRDWRKPKQDKFKENHIQTHHNQTAEKKS